MAEETQKPIIPRGGRRRITVNEKCEAIHLATETFCRRFLTTVDAYNGEQMVRTSADCARDIVEAGAASLTSRTTEQKLSIAARTALDDLEEAYLDYLQANDFEQWPEDDERRLAARRLGRDHADWTYWQQYFESRPAETCCNLMLTLINQTKRMLDGLLLHLTADIRKFGDKPRLQHNGRPPMRAADWERVTVDRLDSVDTSAGLDDLVDEMRDVIDRAVAEIRQRKDW